MKFTPTEQLKSDTFVCKWLARAKELTGTTPDLGTVWTMNPSRLYWALSFDIVEGWEQVAMAEDLLAFYVAWPNYMDSSIRQARELVASTR